VPFKSIAVLCLLGSSLVFAGPKASSKSAGQTSLSKPLDTESAHKAYLDGDFDVATELLESALKSKTAFSHEDSLFIFKHLGVMYAASEGTRERGKYFMMRLLEVEPTARILDMYASDMIYMIFKNIQDEFEVSRKKLTHARKLVDGNNNDPVPSGSVPEKRPAPKTGTSTLAVIGWSTAALVVVGGVAVTAYYLMQPAGTTTKTREVE
jgi:hypothetical protein